MKWYFALSEASIPGNSFLPADSSYIDMIKVAVSTARRNTTLEPHMLYDGSRCDFTCELQRQGVTVHFHRLSFIEVIERHDPTNKLWQRIARGTYLRVDLPLIEQEDEYILYTDCDVLFRRDPQINYYGPFILAVAPEFTR